jgi:hypothetical protein
MRTERPYLVRARARYAPSDPEDKSGMESGAIRGPSESPSRSGRARMRSRKLAGTNQLVETSGFLGKRVLRAPWEPATTCACTSAFRWLIGRMYWEILHVFTY